MNTAVPTWHLSDINMLNGPETPRPQQMKKTPYIFSSEPCLAQFIYTYTHTYIKVERCRSLANV